MKTKITFLSLLAFLFFISNVQGQCTNGSQYPDGDFTPACSGSQETINTDCWAGEYALVNIQANKLYTFASSTATDYITIVDATTGTTVFANGPSGVTWSSGTNTGMIRYYIHQNSACTTQNTGRIRYITCANDVSCGSPTNLSVRNITSNSALLFWTASATAPSVGYDYYISNSNIAPLASSPVNGTTTDTNIFETNLPGNTTRYFWIRTNCGTTKGSWVSGGSFTTIPSLICNSAYFGLYPETTYTPLNTGNLEQIVTDSWAGEYTNVNILPNRQYTFTSSVATDFITITNASGTVVYASGITPLNWNSGVNTGVIRYHLHANSACADDGMGRIRYITSQQPCSTPTGLFTSDVTSTSAVINWSVSAVPSNGYDYIASTSPTTPTNATAPTANVNNMFALVAAGILPNTTYYWWVRSNCGTLKSAWIAGGNFLTLPSNPGNGCTQGALYPSVTYSPSCSGNPELITAFAYAGEYTNVSVANGRRLTFASSNATDFITITNTLGTQILAYGVTPVVYNIDSGSTTLRYYIHKGFDCGVENANRDRYITCSTTVCPSPLSASSSNATANGATMSWVESTTPGSGYEYYINTSNVLSPQYNTLATGTSATTSKTVSNLNAGTTYHFWVRAACTASSKSNWLYGGSFTTLVSATCGVPSSLGVSNITSNSAQISWVISGTPSPIGYQYYLSTVNVAPNGATVPVDTTGAIVLQGLNSNTTYYYWVRTNCSASLKSAWVSGGSFTTVAALSCNGTAGAFGLYPGDTYTVTACNALMEVISDGSWAGEYSNVNVSPNTFYTFKSSVATDYITITNDTGNVVYASGVTPILWYSSSYSGVIRYFIHTNSSCGSEQVNRTRSISCGQSLISIVGDAAAGWDNDVNLSSVDGVTYTLNNYTLTTGGLKFRQNGGWNVNWGANTFPTGTGFQDGPNIPVVACTYNITFNTLTNNYTFVSTSSQPAQPTGAASQAFCNAATIANLNAVGTNIKWYSAATGGNLLTSVTPLASGTTYYASQSNTTCESIARLAVTATINVTPVATAPAAQTFCLGSIVGNLVATGTSKKWYTVPVNGSSLPPAALLATGTYYVTQTLNSCESARIPVNVVVNPNTTPTFTAVAPICSGATLSALPTTSNNGITGTWSPALNNTATTTYTFTPTAGQCATNKTLVITVNPKVTPTFTGVAPICSGATLNPLPVDSNNGINGSWSPALNNTVTTTYTFTPSVGQCANTTTMTIAVTPIVTPTFTQVPPMCEICPVNIGSTYTGNSEASSIGFVDAPFTQTLVPVAGNPNQFTTASAWGALFVPNLTGNPAAIRDYPAIITVNDDYTVTVTGINTPQTPNRYPGGTGTYDPCTDTFDITLQQGVFTNPFTVHVTYTPVAGSTLSPLPTTSNNGITGAWSPALNNAATTTYTFTPSAGQCATTATMTINVTPAATPTFTQVAAICSGAALSALPTTSNNGITGTWSPALNNTATTTYTFTPTAGQCAATKTMVITVNPNVAPTFNGVPSICSGATLSALPTTSNNGITGTWSPAMNNTATTTYTFTPTAGQCALPTTITINVNPNVTPTFNAVAPICSGAALSALPTTSNNGITGTWSPALNNTATTTYTFTPTAGQCATTKTLVITVNPNATPTFTAVAPICSGAALSALPTTSNNGITGTWSPALNNTATTTYTFTPTAGQCATTKTLVITVNPNVTPTFTAVAPICSGAALSALPTTSNNGITGTWSPALNNTATTTYTFTPTAGQCATTKTLVITVNPNATPTFTAIAPICSGAALSALPTTSNNGITGTWSPALNNTATTTYTFTPTAGQCATTKTLVITVNPNVTPTFNAVAQLCSGAALSALPTTSNNGITGTWSPALNNTATTTYTFTPTAGQCATTKTLVITVNPNATPTFTSIAPICSGATLAALPTTSNNGFTGTWSPALNNTATTYTFTPTAGQCALTTTMVIIVNPNVGPTFDAVASICSGAALSALPTTSNNGITGIWSPALNNTATTTYTFTPTAGQCALTATMSITVNPNATPAFTAVAPICSGAALSALPTTSNNGITGTWSPALNNTATTTYTFTPTVGQCALTTTMSITVNPNVTPAFTAVAPICSGAALSALPTTSNNGITGTWLPALNNTATTTYTFTPAAGQCALITTMSITVNPNATPAFTAVAPICSGAALSALPTTSNNGIAGIWSPALNNTATTTYTFTPTAGQCALSTTMVITVNPNVVPTFDAVAPICSGAALSALPTTSNNGITGTWSPALDNTATTTYMFTPTAGQCALTTTMTITVNPNVAPTFDAVAPICSGAALAALPTTSNNGITGTWSPALDNIATTTYMFTPTAGQCAFTTTMTITVNPNVAPTFDTVAPICSGAALSALPTTSNNGITGTWSPALDNTATTTYMFTPTAGQCALTTTMTITVNPNVAPTFDAVAPICSGAALSALPTTSNNGITGTWSPALDNTATTTYTFTPDGTQCAATTTLTITINALPLIAQVSDVLACESYTLPVLANGTYYTAPNAGGTTLNAGDVITSSVTLYVFADNGDCQAEASFDITITNTPVVDDLADVSACDAYTLPALTYGNYYSESGAAGTMHFAGEVITTSQTMYIYVLGTTANCTGETDFTVTINASPLADAPSDVTTCDSYTLPALSAGNYFTAPNGAGTMLAAGDFITVTQTLYVYASNGDCSVEHSFVVTVDQTPVLGAFSDIVVCDSYTLPTLTTGNYYTEPDGVGTMLMAGDTVIVSQTIYVYAANGNCSAEDSFDVIITPTPIPDAPASVMACDSYVLPVLTVGNYYTGPNGTGTLLMAGDMITVTQTLYPYASNGDCSAQNSFTITIIATPVVDAFGDVAVCSTTYTLPVLSSGNYFTAPNGTGVMMAAGDVISESQTIYVFAENGLCSAESSFNVVITTTDSTTTLTEATITANQSGAAYQWIDCGNANAPIDGETGQSFTPAVNGSYAVIITAGSCEVTSDCVLIDTLSIGHLNPDNAITMYPNPSNGIFTVDTGNIVADHISVIDNLGRLILESNPASQRTVLDAGAYADGIYYIKISYKGKETTKKLILEHN